MSNRLFQGYLQQMKEYTDKNIGVVDETSTVVACTELGRIGEIKNISVSEVFVPNKVTVIDGDMYFPFGLGQKSENAVFIEHANDESEAILKLIAVSLGNIKQLYDEKYDRGNFVKNIITDNILPGDIYLKARELHFDIEIPRAVLIVRIDAKKSLSAYDLIQNLFPEKNKDFIITINETDIAVVKEVRDDTTNEELEKLAQSICDSLSTDFFGNSQIGIGTIVGSLKDLAGSFREAQVALEVGKVFDMEKSIVNYENLGIARLIYQLPTTLCEMFMKEVFKKGSIESMDHETLETIQKFFENNLNVSETSRKLYVHRNTLVYRLEKIRKFTGLDLREFDDAIVFKVALMVQKYLDTRPAKY
ncbi:MAG: helix-turn-helix domain-containing protein [Clostridia bacterium]|nr:helix-turn-helix domain-containing protein [Clostridia bacterium]